MKPPPIDVEVVDLSRPVFTTPDGTGKFAVWGFSPTAKRVAVMRYVTRAEALAEGLPRADHAVPVAGAKPNKLSGAYLTALARR